MNRFLIAAMASLFFGCAPAYNFHRVPYAGPRDSSYEKDDRYFAIHTGLAFVSAESCPETSTTVSRVNRPSWFPEVEAPAPPADVAGNADRLRLYQESHHPVRFEYWLAEGCGHRTTSLCGHRACVDSDSCTACQSIERDGVHSAQSANDMGFYTYIE